nr:glycosyltransferase N-terminal domain-containing protein [Paracoccaceae bacterium]
HPLALPHVRIFGKMKGLAPTRQTGFFRPMAQLDVKSAPGMRYRAFLAVYAGLMALGEHLVWLYFRRRAAKDPRYGLHLEERRGKGAPFAADLWVHAVSLGEMTSAEPLVRKALDDGARVVTTHATPAGRVRCEAAFADEIAAGQLALRYAPIDRMSYWKLFFDQYRPKAGLVMEMEFWPIMIEAANSAGVPLVLANSQLPARSLDRAFRQARWLGHPAERAAAVFAKSAMMAERFRGIGVAKVEVMGETRFDMELPPKQLAAGRALRQAIGRPVVCLASVVAGEEAIYSGMLAELLQDDAPPFVIWVPRAPEMFDAMAEHLKAEGLRVLRRQEVLDEDLILRGDLRGRDVLLGDSLGEMAFYIAAADAVLVGGGFTPKGTHNVIEPLAQGKPVITGPDTRTIEFPAIEASAVGVLTICQTQSRLAPAVRAAVKGGSEAATAFHARHAGASDRIYAAVRPMLKAEG